MNDFRFIALGVVVLGLASMTLLGCQTASPIEKDEVRIVAVAPSKLVEIPIVVTPKEGKTIEPGKSIVIADIEGPCSKEVKTALMRRLTDNSDFDVLTRDNLRQIIDETSMKWNGAFNTETGAKIGELMAASLFIVGEVHYCGAALESHGSTADEATYSIMGTFQIIDLETRKVLASSSSEGAYTPRHQVKPDISQAVVMKKSRKSIRGEGGVVVVAPSGETSGFSAGASISSSTVEKVEGGVEEGAGDETEVRSSSGEKWVQVLKPETYNKIMVADDLANGFADKFFARSTWEKVEMWRSDLGRYGDSLRQVRLGQCPLAVETLESMHPIRLYTFHEIEFAEYLHNLGVALLCANRAEEAAEKLRSSYRVGRSASTLKMLGLANKIREWSLYVEVDTQPELDILVTRGPSPL
ncbi:MAG: CsgG/HfaB family protein [Acidobacteriota bacterium]